MKVKVGQINTYVPSVKRNEKGDWILLKTRKVISDKEGSFLQKATYRIPQALQKFAIRLDGSNWKFASGLWERAKEVKKEYHGKNGIRIYASPEVTWLNEEEQWSEIREAISESVEFIKNSLKGSLQGLEKKFKELDAQEADGLVVDRVQEALERLKNLSFVIASFSLSEDFKEAERAVSEVIESELVLARAKIAQEAIRSLAV